MSQGSFSILMMCDNSTGSIPQTQSTECSYSLTCSVSASGGVSLSVIESSVGATSGQTITITRTFTLTTPAYRRNYYATAPLYTNYTFYRDGSTVGSATKLSSIITKTGEY